MNIFVNHPSDELKRELKNKAARIHRSLIRRGFDQSRGIRIGCSQCKACVCNGVALHECGCPNENYKAERE
jgi:hypothetical protein